MSVPLYLCLVSSPEVNISLLQGKEEINPTSLSKNNKTDAGHDAGDENVGMPVRLLGVTGGLGLQPTSAVHAQE